LNFDLRGALRALKPQRRTRHLERRADSELRWADEESPVGGPILLDTCVYLDLLQGRSPAAVDDLLNHRTCHHSCVCLAELTHVFGRLDPSHAETKSVLEIVGETIAEIPGHRLHAPDAAAWGVAGMLTGALTRLAGAPKGHGRLQNDSLIALQARALGAAVLTRNIGDFDFLSRLLPALLVVNYRRSDRAEP
jgi:predicted nucleic acid-binding protein